MAISEGEGEGEREREREGEGEDEDEHEDEDEDEREDEDDGGRVGRGDYGERFSFVHTRRCREGAPALRLVNAYGGARGVRVPGTKLA